MMRNALLGLTLAALVCGGVAQAQSDGGYRLVPNWPTMPADMFFGLKEAPLPPAEREAQAAARRARGGQRGAAPTASATGSAGGGPQTAQPGISGLAIDAQDRVYRRSCPSLEVGGRTEE